MPSPNLIRTGRWFANGATPVGFVIVLSSLLDEMVRPGRLPKSRGEMRSRLLLRRRRRSTRGTVHGVGSPARPASSAPVRSGPGPGRTRAVRRSVRRRAPAAPPPDGGSRSRRSSVGMPASAARDAVARSSSRSSSWGRLTQSRASVIVRTPGRIISMLAMISRAPTSPGGLQRDPLRLAIDPNRQRAEQDG